MKTLIEIAKEKGALLLGKYNSQEPCIEICESELKDTFDAYCKQFVPVAYRQHIEVTTNGIVTKEFGYSDI